MTLTGADISRYNGRPDFAKAKAGGCSFIIQRGVSGAKGGYIDPSFSRNYEACKKAGMPIGIYIASYLNTDREIALTKAILKGRAFEYPIYFDVEDFSFSGKTKSKSRATNAALKFCREIESLGYYVGIYTNKAFLDRYLDKQKIKTYDIWIAHWGRGKNYYKGKYNMHQYTNKARFAGIPGTSEGGVDGNYCHVNYPEIIKGASLNGFKKPKISEIKKEDIMIDYGVFTNNGADNGNVDRIVALLGGKAVKIDKGVDRKAIKQLVQIGGPRDEAIKPDIFLAGKNRLETDQIVTDWIKSVSGGK